jgi:hypothetical protein
MFSLAYSVRLVTTSAARTKCVQSGGVIAFRRGHAPTQQLNALLIERNYFYLRTAKINAKFHLSPVYRLCIAVATITYNGSN